jgi:ATPase
VKVEMVTNNKCIVYVPATSKPAIIGRGGATIELIEKKLGLSIDVREISDKTSSRNNTVQYQVKFDKKNITFLLHSQDADKDTDLYINDEYLLTVKSGKNAGIKINKQSSQGKELVHAFNEDHKIELRQ